MRAARAVAAIALFGVMAASALPGRAHDRRQNVAGWQIRSRAADFGGRIVRMERRGGGWRFEYHLGFWPGFGAPKVGAVLRRGRCIGSESDLLQEPNSALSVDNVQGRIADYVRICPLSNAGLAELRQGLDQAWPVFRAWAIEAGEAIDADALSGLDQSD